MHFNSELEMLFKHDIAADDHDIYEAGLTYTDTNMFVVFDVEEENVSRSRYLVSLKLFYRKTGAKDDYLERVVAVKIGEDSNQEIVDRLNEFIDEYRERGITVYDSRSDILQEWG